MVGWTTSLLLVKSSWRLRNALPSWLAAVFLSEGTGISSLTISRWISFKAQGSIVLWPGRELLLPGAIGGWIGFLPRLASSQVWAGR
eukprot:2671857-Amphidinium_carterae.1